MRFSSNYLYGIDLYVHSFAHVIYNRYRKALDGAVEMDTYIHKAYDGRTLDKYGKLAYWSFYAFFKTFWIPLFYLIRAFKYSILYILHVVQCTYDKQCNATKEEMDEHFRLIRDETSMVRKESCCEAPNIIMSSSLPTERDSLDVVDGTIWIFKSKHIRKSLVYTLTAGEWVLTKSLIDEKL